MGMFDYIRSSYDLGEQFTNTTCQTKDIEEGIGGTMTDYWIDPTGRLWYSSYADTHDLTVIEENDPEYNHKMLWTNYRNTRTGKHGSVKTHKITKYIKIYLEQWSGGWHDWPTLRLHFRNGILLDYSDITKDRWL